MKGWGATLLPSNWTWLTPAVQCASTTVEGCQACWLGHLLQYMRKYNAQSPKQGRKRFNSMVKTIYFSYLSIIYLWELNGQVHDCTQLESEKNKTSLQMHNKVCILYWYTIYTVMWIVHRRLKISFVIYIYIITNGQRSNVDPVFKKGYNKKYHKNRLYTNWLYNKWLF